MAEFDCLTIANYYDSIEITVLGHFEVSSKHFSSLLNFVQGDLRISRSVIKDWLDAVHATSASQTIFLARNCKEWYIPITLCVFF